MFSALTEIIRRMPTKPIPLSINSVIRAGVQLEKFQRLVRAHLESTGRSLVHDGSSTELGAADKARQD